MTNPAQTEGKKNIGDDESLAPRARGPTTPPREKPSVTKPPQPSTGWIKGS